jgi:hypothetical protein
MARAVRAEVDRGRRVVLLHNLNSETLADPEALLERVYLTTGHRRFEGQVLVFGHRRCRYDCLPIRRLEAVDADTAALAAGPERAVAFYSKALGPRRHVEEAKIVLAALKRHFAVRPGLDPAPGFGRLALLPRADSRPAVAFEGESEPLPLDLAWLANPRVPGGVVRTSPQGERAFRYGWSAVAVATEEATVDLLLGCDGRLRLSVDGEPVVERHVLGFTLWRERVHFPRGRHALALEYQTRSGAARLLFQPEAPLRD